jgi:antitoxin component of MazEF toxin-antitoxin module
MSLTEMHTGDTMYIQEVNMIKKLVSHGNSAALIIDKPIMELLKVNMETPLEISTDGRNLIISPVESEKRGKRFKSELAKVNKAHGTTLRKLAK